MHDFLSPTAPWPAWGITLLLVTAVGGALAIAVYDFLSGRNLLRDLRDKRRLRARSLAEWDEHWARNPRRSDIVVCLTTTPSRIAFIDDVLCSLMAQTVRPSRIRLHLPDYSLRENRIYHLPPELKDLRSLEIVHCDDHGPATKLVPALRELPADQRIVVVDDDMVYPPGMLETLEASARAHPDTVCAMSGWIVPDDLTDRPTTLAANVFERPPVPVKCSRIRSPRRVDVFQGYSGYLVRPRFFDLDAVMDYSNAPPQAMWVDDVWLSAHCKAPKYVFPHRRYPCSYWSRRHVYASTALGRLNRGNGDPATRSNSVVIRHLADRWMVSARHAPVTRSS